MGQPFLLRNGGVTVKKIMCLLFVVFFTMLSIITFFNYSNYCEMLPYEGLKEISVKQLRGNYTNKDYIKLLEEKMASINADLMYRATDFSSEKTSYILYKTNNKDDFFQKLDLKNNGKILSPNQCFSTLSTVKNFEVYPMGISSATCDVTIEDFSYIEKYVLKSCVFYTSSDDVYTVMEALKELGLLVELTDSGFAQSMNDMQQPYLLLFVLMCLSIIFYLLSQGRKYAVKRMNGYTAKDVIAEELKRNFTVFGVLLFIIEFVNFLLVSVLYKNTFTSYFMFSVRDILLSFVGILAIFLVAVVIVVKTSNNYGLYLKGKSKKKAIFIVSLISKIAFLIMLVINLSICFQLINNSYSLFVQSKNISSVINNRAATNLYTEKVDLDNEDVYYEYVPKFNKFYDITVDKFDGIYINSLNYQTAPDGVSSFAEYSGQKEIIIDKNYLSVNPIHKADGTLISEKDFVDGKLNILVSESRGYTQEGLYDEYNSLLEMYFGTANINDLHMIVYKENETINSFNAMTGQTTLGHLDNPDIVIYDSEIMTEEMLPGMSNYYYLLKVNTDDPYSELLPYLKQAGIEDVVLETPFVENTFSNVISTYVQDFVYQLAFSMVYLISSVILSIFMAKIYIENNKEKIAIEKLCGVSFFDIYKKYIILLIGIILFLTVACIIMKIYFSMIIEPICLLLIIILDLVVFFITEKRVNRKNILSVLKGE